MQNATIHPGRLLTISGGYWQASALHAAVKLDVFSAIGEVASSAADVARKVGADPRATAMLLSALAAMDLLATDGEVFRNTEESRRFLVRSSPRLRRFYHPAPPPPRGRLEPVGRSRAHRPAGTCRVFV